MEEYLKKAVVEGAGKYSNTLNKHLEYGTAGFRDKADILPHVMYRMGFLAVLRSKSLKGATIGVMITASHNPEQDNGVKLCDPMGEMISPEWEVLATELANAKDSEFLICLQKICSTYSLDLSTPASVFLAMDTRSSSPSLSAAVTEACKALKANLNFYGLLTTPQLHYMVCCQNTSGSYGKPTKEGYYEKLSSAFLKLQSKNENNRYKPNVHVDGANGVGASVLKEFIPYFNNKLNIDVFNCGESALNYKCGADHVKIQQAVPVGATIIPNERYASLDGDADRLIYFYIDDQKTFHMLDGDKIASLYAKHLKELVQECGLNLQLRVIQTAYANGSSTNYIENVLGIPVICMPTGVKHLHHEASKYDIGVYFEANGHGTILFGKNAKSVIKSKASDNSSVAKSAEKLLNTINLINETVGDAISCLLLVETILQNLDWNASDWDKLYTDLPSRQLKLKVTDKSLIVTGDAKCTCVQPPGLQENIKNSVSKYKSARAFVRPSGTEDIVRVYAEADIQENADALAEEVASIVKKFTEK